MRITEATAKFEPFSYKNLSDLEATIKKLKLNIPISKNIEILKTPVKFGEIFIPNRFAINPMEGFDANLDGSPTDLTSRRYRRYAKGGIGLIWFEATAIDETCRSNEHQLMITEKNLDAFKALVSETRELCNQTLKDLGFSNQGLLILQLNHSGRYSRRGKERFPMRAYHNSDLDAAIGASEEEGTIISDNELNGVESLWVKKAILAKEAGFDGVDIKACHGYLISELLSARVRDDSEYGGNTLTNRAKLLFNIVKSLKNEFKSPDFFVTTRLGIYDGVPYPNGFGIKQEENDTFPATVDLTEPLEIIKGLYQRGVRLINISAGNPHYKPHITRPYNKPVSGGQLPAEHPLYGVNRMINLTTTIKQKISNEMILVGSCYSYLRQYAGYVAANLVSKGAVDICGFGRMAFANPNFPRQIFQEGKIDTKKTCITCSKCTELMKLGKSTGCVVRDPQYS